MASGEISQLLGISAEILGLLVELWPNAFSLCMLLVCM